MSDPAGWTRISELEEECRRLRKIATEAIDELGLKHSAHWDSTGQRGKGCPACIRESASKQRLREALLAPDYDPAAAPW